jgi:hypothetical protein
MMVEAEAWLSPLECCATLGEQMQEERNKTGRKHIHLSREIGTPFPFFLREKSDLWGIRDALALSPKYIFLRDER